MTVEGDGKNIEKKKIVILGGGFAGLRIAYLLDKLEYKLSLIEKSKNPGGMVQTFCYQYEDEQFRFDFGPHIFFEDYVREYKDLLGNKLVPIANRFRMCTEKSIYSYPIDPFEILTRTGPIRFIAYLIDFLINRVRPQGFDEEDDSLEKFLSMRFGKRLFNDFYSPYIEKCCGLPPDQISLLWAKERENVTGKNLSENIKNKIKSIMSSKTRQKLARINDPSAKNITAWYPRMGAGQLCDAMAVSLKDQEVYLNATIRQVNVKNHSVQNVVVEIDGQEKIIDGDYYVSTIPLPQLFEYLKPVSPLINSAGQQLKYRRVRLVCLIVERERILDCLEMFSMDRRHLFKRVYEPKAMSELMSPKGKSSLCLEVCCNTGDRISEMPFDELVSRAIEDLISIKLIKSKHNVKDAFIREIPQAYPVYAKGFEKYRQQLLDEIARFDNFLTCGRQGLFRYHAMTNEIMEMAESVARFLDGHRDKTLADNKRSQWGQVFY